MISEIKPENLVNYQDWINKALDPEWPPERLVRSIFEGKLKAVSCSDEGILIYGPKDKTAWVFWFYTLPTKGGKYVPQIYDYLRKEGFLKVRAGTKRADRGFRKITGMTRLFTVYEKEL